MNGQRILVAADREGSVAFGDYETWYRISGTPRPGVPPLVVLHGGPGFTSDYLLPVADIAASGRAVVHYDQLGNGRSTHLPEQSADFWTPELFLAELDNLLVALELGSAYHVLGHAWGGMLAAEHAVRRPRGLRSLTLANAPASMALWTQATAQLRTQLPAEVQAGLVKHDSSALQAFRDRHVCRVAQTPAELAATMAALAADSTVYTAMNGPNELEVTGSLRGWTVMDSLPRIAVPTLVISGAKDIATPECVQPFVDDIPKARQRVFPESSHMPHIEERDAFIRVVSGFLSEVDAPKT